MILILDRHYFIFTLRFQVLRHAIGHWWIAAFIYWMRHWLAFIYQLLSVSSTAFAIAHYGDIRRYCYISAALLKKQKSAHWLAPLIDDYASHCRRQLSMHWYADAWCHAIRWYWLLLLMRHWHYMPHYASRQITLHQLNRIHLLNAARPDSHFITDCAISLISTLILHYAIISADMMPPSAYSHDICIDITTLPLA